MDEPGGAFHRRGGVALVANDASRISHARLERCLVSSRVVGAVGAVVPLDCEGVAALDRRPGVRRNDCDTAQRLELGRYWRTRDLDDVHYARYLQRLGRIVRNDPAAVDCRARDDRIQHSLKARVDAVLAASGDDVRTIDYSDFAFADVAELRR